MSAAQSKSEVTPTDVARKSDALSVVSILLAAALVVA